ncbi:hypothetical protein EDD18DRAFT_1332949 [Armillaria luteobubalina]|uniref:Uncharacterized protein n=1 Tax=Armillaria luteobubalina TaxID=153913 RepID=A0AA39Q2J0_9AGAR|nr:hypothetical protein EDD18DRAFT_1332949 [Armillaria luteobubalina]
MLYRCRVYQISSSSESNRWIERSFSWPNILLSESVMVIGISQWRVDLWSQGDLALGQSSANGHDKGENASVGKRRIMYQNRNPKDDHCHLLSRQSTRIPINLLSYMNITGDTVVNIGCDWALFLGFDMLRSPGSSGSQPGKIIGPLGRLQLEGALQRYRRFRLAGTETKLALLRTHHTEDSESMLGLEIGRASTCSTHFTITGSSMNLGSEGNASVRK